MTITPHLRANRLRLLAQQTAVFDADCGDWTGASCGYWWRKLRLLRILAQIKKKSMVLIFSSWPWPWCAAGAWRSCWHPPGTFLVLRKVCLITHGRREAKTQPHHARKDCHGQIKKFKFQNLKSKNAWGRMRSRILRLLDKLRLLDIYRAGFGFQE